MGMGNVSVCIDVGEDSYLYTGSVREMECELGPVHSRPCSAYVWTDKEVRDIADETLINYGIKFVFSLVFLESFARISQIRFRERIVDVCNFGLNGPCGFNAAIAVPKSITPRAIHARFQTLRRANPPPPVLLVRLSPPNAMQNRAILINPRRFPGPSPNSSSGESAGGKARRRVCRGPKSTHYIMMPHHDMWSFQRPLLQVSHPYRNL